MKIKTAVTQSELYLNYIAPCYRPLKNWIRGIFSLERIGLIINRFVKWLLYHVPLPIRVAVVLHRATEIPAQVSVRGHRILVSVSSQRELWRVNTYETKERETLDWIDTFMNDSVFFDIGANIGTYSLYAAAQKAKAIKTYAFEPLSLNYASLNKNIYLNGYSESVEPYCLAQCREMQFSTLHVRRLAAGSSHSQFQNKENDPNSQDGYNDPVHIEGMIGVSLDELCGTFDFPYPNYIKIDVDGIELEIVKGAKAVLSHPNLRSILVEIDNEDELRIAKEILLKSGFQITGRSHKEKGKNYIFQKEGL